MSDTKFVEMWKPIKIGPIEIKNRFAMAPVCNGIPDHGLLNEQFYCYYARRARGGVGLIIPMPATAFTGGSKPPVMNGVLQDITDLNMWNELVETIHAFGSKVIIQSMCGSAGRQVPRGTPTKSASAVPLIIRPENLPKKEEEYRVRKGLWPSNWDKMMWGAPPVEYTTEEVKEIEQVWANQVLLIKQTGADGAELHFAHGYMGHNFLSPRENLRGDEYGGSLENRMRLHTNVIRRARALVGPNFPIGARMVGTDRMPGGLGIEESIKIINRFIDCSLDFIDMSDGCWEQAQYMFPCDEDGTMIPIAAELKKECKIPIFCANIHKPELGEAALKAGKIDMIALGRPLNADPDYVNKCAEQGKGAKITKCIRCMICSRRSRFNLSFRCEVNREVGNEKYDTKNWRINAPYKKQYWIPNDY